VFNGLMMLISPVRWYDSSLSLPGSIRKADFETPAGRFNIRLLGLVFLCGSGWMIVQIGRALFAKWRG
jgi:hypothetical protein